jgi:uncharacterized membrane protein YhaH (DUF805 family)
MSFTQAVGSVLRQYATFSGRARRSEYWWFYLFTVLAGLGAAVVDGLLGAVLGRNVEVVNLVVSLAVLVPSIAVGARRLHDTGRTGWWLLLPVVPLLLTVVLAVPAMVLGLFAAVDGGFDVVGGATVAGFFLSLALMLVGGIVLLVFFCQDSQPGPNKYGFSPKHPMPGGGYVPPQPGAYLPQG